MGKAEVKQNRVFTEKVKAAINLVQLIEKTVPLHKESNEWYAGATNANSQSGSSLKVNSREQWYKNFATGDGGDVFNWIAYAHGLDIVDDFPQIIKIAADEAGIPCEGYSKEDKERIEEIQIIHTALTDAAELYHSNLTPELRDYITRKWGIDNNTIDALKIGYARPVNDFIGIYDLSVLKRTGLLIKIGDTYKEHFTGRITFPYWCNGKVVNFAARGDKEFLKTPDNEYEKAKYKKLIVHSDRHPYVSFAVNNRYLYGEDSIRKQNFCIITEGIADATVLMQNGYPVLSPVTVKFADNDIPTLISAAKHMKTVYICNDNEKSETGEKGAIKTALLLKNEGVAAKVIVLPKENLDKMDVAEYFLRHTKTEFEEVKEHSKDILVHLLSKVQPSTCYDATIAKTENFRKAMEFTKNVLKNIRDVDEVTFFIQNNIKNYFPKFVNDDIRIIVKSYKSAIAEDSDMSQNQDQFDLDSESGRSTMVQVLAKEIEQKEHMKFVAGTLRIYENGVYPANPESIKKLQREILTLATVNHKTPIMEKHTNAVIKILEIMHLMGKNEYNTTEDEIAVNNGILNLKTYELTEFSPDKVFFNKTPVDYIPDAPEPKLFLSLMEKVFKGNEEQLDLMQEVFGFCLLNNYKYQSIIYLLGDGGNGKGTVVKILTYMLGSENTSSATLNQLTDHNNVEYFLAQLHGKKANICGDVGSKKIENTENIKKLSSNTDLISARLPYGVPFDFINTAKLIFAMNKMPKKDAFTTGDKRRDVIISFDNRIADTAEDIKGFAEIIRDSGELPGVLNWSLEGLKRLERNQKFSDKRTIAQKGLEYDMKSNPMKYFVDECIEADPKGGSVPNVAIYQAYSNYRKKYRMPELSEQEIKNGVKYWCSQVGISVSEKKERISKLCGFMTDDVKALLGDKKQAHVFTGIMLIKEDENEGLTAFTTPETVVQTTATTKQSEFEGMFLD